MNSVVLFLFICFPIRLFLTWLSANLSKKYLPVFGAFYLIMAVGILYLYFAGKRLDAPEAGGVTWWAPYRLLIGMLWLTAAIYAFQERQDIVWIPLLIDTLFGLMLFLWHHDLLKGHREDYFWMYELEHLKHIY
jgi:hypothetical protein